MKYETLKEYRRLCGLYGIGPSLEGLAAFHRFLLNCKRRAG